MAVETLMSSMKMENIEDMSFFKNVTSIDGTEMRIDASPNAFFSSSFDTFMTLVPFLSVMTLA